jgi:hypothetical protein
MIHAKELLDRLGSLSTCDFDGEGFRATRLSLDPLTPSTRGGRWSPGRRIGRHGIGCDALHQLRERGSARGAGVSLFSTRALSEQAGEVAPFATDHKKDIAIVAGRFAYLGRRVGGLSDAELYKDAADRRRSRVLGAGASTVSFAQAQHGELGTALQPVRPQLPRTQDFSPLLFGFLKARLRGVSGSKIERRRIGCFAAAVPTAFSESRGSCKALNRDA